MVFQAQVCPNCGAPLKLVGNQCSFCKVPLAQVADGPGDSPGDSPDLAALLAAASAPTGDPSAPFAMRVDDIFSIKKRGTVVTGKIADGTLRVGDALVIEGTAGTRATSCTAIEAFRKTMDTATAGDTVGLMLAGVEKADVTAGDWLRSA